MTVVVDGSPLTVDDVVAVAYRRAAAVAGNDLEARMEPARALVQRVVEDNDTVYGITTGFGALANTHIQPEQASDLQYDLLRSHAAGVGPFIEPEIIVRYLLTLLDHDIVPAVPSQGSVGASGDLAPFAHLALPIIGEGEILVDGVAVPSGPVLEAAGIEPLELLPKEGLSLLNGTEGMLAHGCIALHRASQLVDARLSLCFEC